MLNLLDRKTDEKTPASMKAGAIVKGLFLLVSLNSLLVHEGAPWVAVVSLAAQLIAVLGFWRMRRWAVIVLAAFASASLATAANTGFGPRLLLLVIGIGILPIIPGFLYWRRLTW